MTDCKEHSTKGDWVTYKGKRSAKRINSLSWNRKEQRFAEGQNTASPAFINEVLRREGLIK